MVTREEVLHVARLAKLALSPAEVDRFSGQLARILAYVEQLREIGDATGGPTHTLPLEKNLRPDEPRPSLPRPVVLALAPCADAETMKVPAVIEGYGDA